MIRLFLLGFMGTGKTTLGRALAADLGISFCDLDHYIETRYMKSISSIFKDKGQDSFREVEARLLREVGEFEDVVISCGGSTPLYFNNMQYMNSQGITIWLDSSIPVLFRRLKVARSGRPLISSMNDTQLEQYIGEELARRNPFFSKAAFRYSGDMLESEEQIADSVRGVRSLLKI